MAPDTANKIVQKERFGRSVVHPHQAVGHMPKWA
ncbi:hypothetical protein COLO4_31568 [Corchorus olitorius]|uniref:Uncharacterized protein n=1 Tax=Corchorus olitorius TaxID=93759 RepID=A0A1R3H433_9ROSI|nr:hypothetical protein COLO4_31568 [Corchorus olitorius]